MHAVFITGTDTGVGKTLVAGALAAALRRQGHRVGVFKPCESGCAGADGPVMARDAEYLQQMSGSPANLQAICPYQLREPLAPAVAAAREQIDISIDHIYRTFQLLRSECDRMIVEGAGGLLVPVADGVLTADLIKILALPVLVVARLSLGTVNHTLLTVRQARAEGLPVAGVVLNQTLAHSGAAEETNPQVIAQYADVPLPGVLPFVVPEKRTDAEYLAGLAEQCLDVEQIFL